MRKGARRLGLNADQLGVLSQLLCGERILERVSSEGLAEVHGVVSAALEAGFEPSEFAYLLARAAAEPQPGKAARVLRDRIAQRTNGRRPRERPHHLWLRPCLP